MYVLKISPQSFSGDKNEKLVVDKLAMFLNDDFYMYHNREVNGKEFDLLLLNKELGAFIFEVKGWNGQDIIKVENNELIFYKNSMGETKKWESSPLNQVRGYKFNLQNLIKEKFELDIRIHHAVIYININEEYYEKKNLELLSEKKRSFVSEDFSNNISFMKKLQEVKSLEINEKFKLDEASLHKVRGVFENLSENKIMVNLVKEEKAVYEAENKSEYSYLKFIKKNSEVDYKVLFDKWKQGIKVFVVSDDRDVILEINKCIYNNLGYLKGKKGFNNFDKEKNKYKNSIFNFNLYFYDENDIGIEFEIKNGDYNLNNQENSAIRKFLEAIDSKTNFNLNQYDIEHFNLKEDLMIKAGAGTGKTYSMIARITYLIHSHNYSSEDLKEKIIMITFTNEASDNMKKKIKEYYTNYYILTADIDILELINGIDSMNICTIHSLSKKIIDKYSIELGLGVNSKITSGSYETNKIIKEELEKHRDSENMNINESLDMKSYVIVSKLAAMLEKIEQKNVKLNEKYSFGNPTRGVDNKDFNNLVKVLLPKIQNRLNDLMTDDNKVRLGSMMILISDLIASCAENSILNTIDIEYLFIDEFQDTDDVQIGIIQEFKKLFNFNLFVVGDIKQSIYRFRGATDSAFLKLQSGIKDIITEKELYKNYRTDKMLLEKFHNIFSVWNKKGSLDYDRELIGVKNLNDFEDSIERKDILVMGKVTLDKVVDSNDFKKSFIETLRSEIKVLEEEISEEKTIAILVRLNSEVEKIINICNENNMLVEANIGENLYKTQAAKDLYKLVLGLKYHNDPKYIFGIMRSYLVNDNLELSNIASSAGDKKVILQKMNIGQYIEKWDEHIKNLKVNPVMKIIRDILFECEPWNNYGAAHNKDEQKIYARLYKRNLEQLIEVLINSTNNDFLTINNIAKTLEILIFTGVNEDCRDTFLTVNSEEKSKVKVICTTAHKSKGLEYNTVILPFCFKDTTIQRETGLVEVIVTDKNIGYSIDPKEQKNYRDDEFTNKRFKNNIYEMNSSEENKHKESEEIRILYVAMTRAINKFIYFKNINLGAKEKNRWQDFIGKFE